MVSLVLPLQYSSPERRPTRGTCATSRSSNLGTPSKLHRPKNQREKHVKKDTSKSEKVENVGPAMLRIAKKNILKPVSSDENDCKRQQNKRLVQEQVSPLSYSHTAPVMTVIQECTPGDHSFNEISHIISELRTILKSNEREDNDHQKRKSLVQLVSCLPIPIIVYALLSLSQ